MKPKLGQFGGREQRCLAGLDHVGDQGYIAEFGGNAFEFGYRLRRLDEHCVDPKIAGHLGALEGIVKTVHGTRIGAGRDVQMGAMVDDGAQLGQPVFGRNHLLARHVPATLGPHLILEEHSSGAGLLPQFDRANCVERTAIAGVGIDHHAGAGRRGAHPPSDLGHLSLGKESKIGFAEHGGAHAISAHEHRVELGLDSKLGRQRIPHAGHQHTVAIREPCPQMIASHDCAAAKRSMANSLSRL